DASLPLLAAVFLVLAVSGRGQSEPLPQAPQAIPASRVVVFQAPGFPTVDGPEIPAATLDQALAGLTVTVAASPDALAERLRQGPRDVLLLPYGSAFPLEAWPAIRAFVKGGGGLVVLGGAPFEQPVRSVKAPYALAP